MKNIKDKIVILVVTAVFVATPVIYLYSICAAVNEATVEGIHVYSTTHSADKAVDRIWQYLRDKNLVPKNATISPVQDGKRYISLCPYATTISFTDDSDKVTCSLNYNYLNSKPFRILPKLKALDLPDPWVASRSPFVVVATVHHFGR